MLLLNQNLLNNPENWRGHFVDDFTPVKLIKLFSNGEEKESQESSEEGKEKIVP